MKFLKQQFEEALEARIDSDGRVNVGRYSFEAVEILNLAGDAYETTFHDWLWEDWLPIRTDRLAELLTLKFNESRFGELRNAIGKGCVVPFVGSGMSVPSGLPTWTEFLKKLRKIQSALDCHAFRKMLSAGDFEGIASELFRGMPQQLFEERIEATFGISDVSLVTGPIHFLPLLFDSTIVTTNYDDLLEKLFAEHATTFQDILYGPRIAQYRRRGPAGTRRLLKLHGNYRDPETRVLTREEYDEFYRNGCPGREELSLLFRGHSLLFLGCSLKNDRTMSLLHETAMADRGMPRHYALLSMPRSPNGLRSREHFLTERSIFPIWYDGDHNEDIETFLVGVLEYLKKL